MAARYRETGGFPPANQSTALKEGPMQPIADSLPLFQVPAAMHAPAAMPFRFEGAEVRVVTSDGQPWFVLADVCRVLDLGSPHKSAARLDDDEKGRNTIPTLGGPQEMAVINESGLYSTILTSRKEAARRFKKWVTGEVLPAIRREGGYMIAWPEETPEELMARALRVAANQQDRIKRQAATLDEGSRRSRSKIGMRPSTAARGRPASSADSPSPRKGEVSGHHRRLIFIRNGHSICCRWLQRE